MSTTPVMAAALAAVALFCIGYILYRMRAGHVRHGNVIFTRSDQPVEFWASVLFPTATIPGNQVIDWSKRKSLLPMSVAVATAMRSILSYT